MVNIVILLPSGKETYSRSFVDVAIAVGYHPGLEEADQLSFVIIL